MLKFEEWYGCGSGARGGILANVSTVDCNATLAAYRSNPSLAQCNDHASCILSGAPDKLTPQFLAQFNSATVVLGLTPTLLATLGPTVGEVSLLSSKAPILSFLLSMGATAIYPTRPLDYNEPTEILHKGTIMNAAWAESGFDTALIIIEYVLAAAACANVWQNSYQLGRGSVFAPICTQSWWVVGWTAMPAVIHLLAAVGYNAKIIRGGKKTRANDKHEALQSHDETEPSFSFPNLPPTKTTRKRPSYQHVRQKSSVWVQSVFDRNVVPLEVSEVPWWLKLLNSSCSFLAFAHVIFGVLIFSSLQFVCVGDAVGVLGRYLSSAVVCRVIMILEFARMRLKWKQHPFEQGEMEL